MTFKEYVQICELKLPSTWHPPLSVPLTLNIPSGVFGALPTTSTGSQAVPAPDRALRSGGFVGSPWHHQLFDLGFPTVSKTAQIRTINEKKDPIFIHLSDGTQLFLPLDAFKKIKGEPAIGKTMTIVFQRRPEDRTKIPSKILSIHCF